ncbi:MAG TPA: glycosyltransferase family A protein [Candidatus Elarobacter sp.]
MLPARAEYLTETAAAVSRCRVAAARAGWGLEWVVVVDGPGAVPAVACDQLTRLPERVGIASARNVALANAAGGWIAPLDGDDVFDEAGFTALLAVLDRNRELSWLSGNRLLMDGRRTAHWNAKSTPWPAGTLADSWSSPFPFHPNCLLVRTDLALRVGGWPAVPVNEDMAFALLVAEEAAGASDVPVLTHYRVWDRQETARRTYPALRVLSFPVIAGLLNERRRTRGRPSVDAPLPGPALALAR